MATARRRVRTGRASALGALALVVGATAVSAGEGPHVSAAVAAAPTVEGPIPGAVPGDRTSAVLGETYPFFSTYVDLAAAGYVEEEFYLSGVADGWAADGTQVATDVPYRTRVVVRRPAEDADFNGTVLMEWQNVTAGYDLDALWSPTHMMRSGYAWVGVSAQRVGVDQLRGWSPTRYGTLDVTGGRQFVTDELSYDIFAQTGLAVGAPSSTSASLLGGLQVDHLLAIGASQSATRMRTYYDLVLPQTTQVFDGYAFIVGSAPTREGTEPIIQVLSETDVRSPAGRRPDSDVFRRWEVAGTAHSGYAGQVYRQPLAERDLGGSAPAVCDLPPFSRVPLGQVTSAAYDHLVDWVATGTAPPSAPYLEFNADGTNVRNELGLAKGGIQLSQVTVPTALNTGQNSGASFCRLYGSYVAFDETQLAALYKNHGQYASAVKKADRANVNAGYIVADDAAINHQEAVHSDVGK